MEIVKKTEQKDLIILNQKLEIARLKSKIEELDLELGMIKKTISFVKQLNDALDGLNM